MNGHVRQARTWNAFFGMNYVWQTSRVGHSNVSWEESDFMNMDSGNVPDRYITSWSNDYWDWKIAYF